MKINRLRIAALISLFIFNFASMAFSASSVGWTPGSETLDGKTVVYQLKVPANYDPTKKYPLTIFLHGVGSKGNDNTSQLASGFVNMLNDKNTQAQYPSFILAPQCPNSDSWSSSKIEPLVIQIIETVKANYSIDKNKTYLTGWSMGGYGTQALVGLYPGYFAAAVPMSGSSGSSFPVEAMQQTPLWISHGTLDSSVNISGDKKLVSNLEKAGNTVLKFSETVANIDSLMAPSAADIQVAKFIFMEETDGTHVDGQRSASNSPYLLPWLFSKSLSSDSDKDGLRDDWEIKNFGDLTHGANEDPAQDGIPNLMKFALGLDPHVTSNALMPITQLYSEGGQNYLSISYTPNPAASNISFDVEVTSDLKGPWLSGSGNTGAVPSGTTVTMRDTLPFVSGKRFIRLRVSDLSLATPITQTTVPEGVIAYTMSKSLPPSKTQTAFSLPLTQASVFQGKVSSVTSNSIMSNNPGWTAGAFSSETTPYAVRFKSGNFSGKTLIISSISPNTGDTLTVISDGVSLVGNVETGDTFEVFPCDTLLSLFGTANSTGNQAVLSGAKAKGDEVALMQGGIWKTYYFDSSSNLWKSGTLPFDMGNTIIHPDAGILYGRRAASDFNFSVIGRVANIDPKIAFNTAGSSFVSIGIPTDSTLSSLAINTKISGWINKSPATSPGFDKVAIYDGAVWNRYYLDNATSQWRKGSLPFDMGNVVIPTGSPILIQRASGTSAVGTFSVSLPYPLN